MGKYDANIANAKRVLAEAQQKLTAVECNPELVGGVREYLINFHSAQVAEWESHVRTFEQANLD
jgi:hypothetical protein